jgi:hypothetical protein
MALTIATWGPSTSVALEGRRLAITTEEAAVIVTAVGTWALAGATLLVGRQQRRQAHLDWMRDQVSRLVVELEADHDRVRTPSIGLEVNGQERKYLDPKVPIWSELPELCKQLDEAINVMKQHTSTLRFVSTGMLERRAMSCEVALMDCSTALMEVSILIRGESPWADDAKWAEFEAAMKKWTTASGQLTKAQLAILAEARHIVKAPWKPTLRMRARRLWLRAGRLWLRARKLGDRLKRRL